MANFIPGLIMGFREGLEAFLIVVILFRYLEKIKQLQYKRNIYMGAGLGIAFSLIVGLILYLISRSLGNAEQLAKLWESIASLIALILVTTFIVWMIKNGSNMVREVESKAQQNLSPTGILLISTIMIAREGTEIAIFTFAGNYGFVSILIGLILALIIAVLIYFSLLKVNIKTLFNITLIYLILQAGFLLGYGIHEGLSALKDLGYIASDNFLLAKAFNLQDTIFDHKNGIIGLPLFVLIGWYSRPEWIQFIAHLGYVIILLLYLYYQRKKIYKNEIRY